ncbi:hypothetical protein Tco_0189446, partial [Tanacetum coccineum]
LMEISMVDQIALDDALVAPDNRLKIDEGTGVSPGVPDAPNYDSDDDISWKSSEDDQDVDRNDDDENAQDDEDDDKNDDDKNAQDDDDEAQLELFCVICHKVGNMMFETPLKTEILAFLASLGHSGEIRKITDVNVNKLHQPWRSFAAIINKCLSGKIPPKTKASKKKADSDATTKKKPPTIPKEKKEKKSRKGKQKAKELETISEAILTEAKQLKIITKRSGKETHSSYASGSGADEGTGVSPGSESEDDGDDFIHPKLTTHDDETTHEEETNKDDTFDPIVHTPSHVSSSDDEDSDNEVERVDVEGDKSDEHATYVEDQGNEADRDTNANLKGRDDVMTDVILPQTKALEEQISQNSDKQIQNAELSPSIPGIV